MRDWRFWFLGDRLFNLSVMKRVASIGAGLRYRPPSTGSGTAPPEIQPSA